MTSHDNDAADRQALAVQRLADFLRRLPYVAGFFDDAYIEALARAIYADAASAVDTGEQPDETDIQGRVE